MRTSGADLPPPGTLPRKAVAAEGAALASVLALALFDDPPSLWAFPDPKRRREILPAFLRVFVDASLGQGEAYTVDNLSAAALWFPPGWQMTEAEGAAFEDAVKAAAGEYAESGPLTILGLMERVHPTTPHFYLNFVGTRPDRQGKGIGSVLLNAVLDRCDDERVPAYLEASAERNRRLYERLGFEAKSRIDLPDGPPMWGMWREPRGPDLAVVPTDVVYTRDGDRQPVSGGYLRLDRDEWSGRRQAAARSEETGVSARVRPRDRCDETARMRRAQSGRHPQSQIARAI